jgi:ABC-type polar amino acid transport system ATPase subunit
MDQVDSQGCALMLVTHDQSLADAVAHRSIPLGTDDAQARERKFETVSAP